MPNVRDPVTGVEAPVVVRTLSAAGHGPKFILIGEAESTANSLRSRYHADYERLAGVLHANLGWFAYAGLIRKMLLGMRRNGDVVHLSVRREDLDPALDIVIAALDREMSDATFKDEPKS